MSKKLFVGLMTLCLLLSVACVRLFSAEDAKEEVKVFEFKGAKLCINCHKELDNSVEVWQKEKHAKAFETLGTDAAKAINPDAQTDPACLKCHTTGYGKPGGFALDLEDKKKESLVGVTCEACHGAGEKYNAVMMQAKMKGDYSRDAAVEAGLLIPDEKTCVACHNEESPSYKEFKFDEMSEKIKHGVKLEAKE